MKVIYGVPWIEIESGWGSRPSGWKLFTNEDECHSSTKDASDGGAFEGGYIGPVRPLTCWEIPFDSLDEKLQARLEEFGAALTDDYWDPSFKGNPKSIQ
jgi:hypothetical protein